MFYNGNNVQQKGGAEMDSEDYAKYPNLLRVAKELTRCKHPYKVAGALLSVIECGADDLTDGNEDIGLTVGEVLAFFEQSRRNQ